uniref:ubiquitin carboxyl-terminal hydrolase 47 isoform X2 n=1 Tax=Myxine glutinosa TaxID=7769 RepID=UPI00358FDFB7
MEAGFQAEQKNYLVIADKEGEQPQSAPDTTRLAVVTRQEEGNMVKSGSSHAPEGASAAGYESSAVGYSILGKSDTGYVGLVNQAMTCYLNSLLQTLYMTPEFRNALYKWEFDGTEEEGGCKSIPYQLQRLFVQLQTSWKRAVETTDLTRSFGWDSSEAWQQHDVQELCRVMFDALEQKWKNTEQADLINQLYQGKLKDYVRCLDCGYESSRLDTYLDIPLAIRPFGSNQAYCSVEEALQAFVQPETLDGINQYYCEHCGKKCDAHKGLEFLHFPYMLSLQLKRFDFDYSTMHRIKLNDRMTFPEMLDLNSFIDAPEEEKCCQADSCADSGAENEGSCHSDQMNTDFSGYDVVDEGIDLENATLVPAERTCKLSNKGPWVYELFSIMVHSGSAAGGHYYAFIKSFSDGQWYSFNDQHVTKVTQDDIRKTYGGNLGSRGYYSSTFSSSTNAYMLIYRQIDQSRNSKFMDILEFTSHIQRLVQREKEREDEERRQREIEKNTCKIKLFCMHPVKNIMIESRLVVHKDKNLQEATTMAHKVLDLEEVVPCEQCRLVKYDDFHDSLEQSYEGEEDTPMGYLLGGVKSSYIFDLLLETRNADQQFRPYKPGGVTVKVHVVNLKNETVSRGISVRAYLNQTIGEFKQLINQVTGLSVETMRVVLERYYNELRLLSSPLKTLKAEDFLRSNKVFVESSDSADGQSLFHLSNLWRLLDRHGNTIRLLVSLPESAAIQSSQNEALRSSEWTAGGDGVGHQSVAAILEESTERLRSLSLEQARQNREHHTCWNREDDESSSSHKQAVSVGEISNQLAGVPDSSDSEVGGSGAPCDSDATTGSPSQDLDSSASADSRADNEEDAEQGLRMDAEPLPLLENGASDSRPIGFLYAERLELQNECSASSVDSDRLSSSHSSDTLCNVTEGSLEPLSSLASLPAALPVQHRAPDNQSGNMYDHSSGELATGSTETPECSGRQSYRIHHELKSTNGSDGEEELKKGEGADAPYAYFHAEAMPSTSTTPPENARLLSVYVDKRMKLATFKRHLESYVGVPSSQFKVFRVYASNQEFESVRLNETLSSFSDDNRVIIRLGRALKKGEYMVKVFQLQLGEAEPCKYLLDTVFAKSMTVRQSKQELVHLLRERCDMDVSIDRLRLRKKTWKNPGTIFLDSQAYEDNIPIFSNWEVFLELLDGPDRMTSMSQLAVLARRWRPSQLILEQFQEVVLETNTVEELKMQLSEISGLSVEDIEFSKGRGTFPCDMSVLDIHQDLEWNPKVSTLNVWPLYICDDGAVVFYRDRREELLELPDERRNELQKRENMRLQRTQVSCSPRKEKALKIYVDGGPSRETPVRD